MVESRLGGNDVRTIIITQCVRSKKSSLLYYSDSHYRFEFVKQLVVKDIFVRVNMQFNMCPNIMQR